MRIDEVIELDVPDFRNWHIAKFRCITEFGRYGA